MPPLSPVTPDPFAALRDRILAATRAACGDDAADVDAALHRSQHADYQADLALALARKLKKNPREVATAIAARLPADDVIAAVEVSGPGFLNITLAATDLAARVEAMRADQTGRLAVSATAPVETVVIDYSGPNVAKEMHVGHLRSTCIGDSLARLLEWQGHRVIRRNHVGDWGTPVGMLIEHLLDVRAEGAEAGVRELGAFYRAARVKFDGDPAFADRARQRVVLLQPGVVEELAQQGRARESEGAMCVFPPGFTGREGEPTPLIIRKQEGGFGYATTDLAALRQRVRELGATRIIYVVGSPQTQHLAMVFAVARLAGWAGDGVRLEHVAFGSVLGPAKKMLEPRAGDSVSLAELLSEADTRAGQAVAEKSPELPADEQARIAHAVGMGAIKYADLANDRIKDYVFDWKRMLAFEGNTAP